MEHWYIATFVPNVTQLQAARKAGIKQITFFTQDSPVTCDKRALHRNGSRGWMWLMLIASLSTDLGTERDMVKS